MMKQKVEFLGSEPPNTDECEYCKTPFQNLSIMNFKYIYIYDVNSVKKHNYKIWLNDGVY